jgi:cytochrome c oxidase subunit 1
MSFIVWAHHMFMTGMGTTLSTFFQATTMIISVPSVIILTCLILSLYGASIRFTVPMLFALAFLPMFAIGGLTGLPLGLTASDIHLHDTFYVIGHFHYVVAPGTIFAVFAGIYYWFPKVTGRKMNDFLGKLHFWPSFIFINAVFMPMRQEWPAYRRLDQTIYAHGDAVRVLPHVIVGTWLLGWRCLVANSSLVGPSVAGDGKPVGSHHTQ